MIGGGCGGVASGVGGLCGRRRDLHAGRAPAGEFAVGDGGGPGGRLRGRRAGRAGAGAVLAFAVTLSGAASRTVPVDVTSDGSAQAGEDYTAMSGTLTFEAGESGKTVEVAVLDDAHDEGRETLTL